MSASALKQRDLTPCAACGKGLAHDGSIMFFRLRVEQFVLMPNAIERARAFETVMGSPALAGVVGPDEDLAKRLAGEENLVICQKCSIESCLAWILERVAKNRADATAESA